MKIVSHSERDTPDARGNGSDTVTEATGASIESTMAVDSIN